MKKIFFIVAVSLIFFISCQSKDYNLEEYTVENNEEYSENQNGTIKVYITGEIKRSGVYEVDEKSRIIDLVEIAGGFTKDADTESINLAKYLNDGEKILIPKKGQKVNIENTNSDIIDISSCTLQDLTKLPGIGEKTAATIIEYRDKNNFKNFEDLLNIPGIGKKTLESLKGKISLGGKIYEWD